MGKLTLFPVTVLFFGAGMGLLLFHRFVVSANQYFLNFIVRARINHIVIRIRELNGSKELGNYLKFLILSQVCIDQRCFFRPARVDHHGLFAGAALLLLTFAFAMTIVVWLVIKIYITIDPKHITIKKRGLFRYQHFVESCIRLLC
jgi:hypothetical protein